MMVAQFLPQPARIELFASAARTATANSATQTNHQARGVAIFIDVTAAAATPSVVPKIEQSFDGGTTWLDLFVVAAALTATGDYTYLLYPGINPAADGAYTESVNLVLPRTWRLTMTHADADSFTYSVTAMQL